MSKPHQNVLKTIWKENCIYWPFYPDSMWPYSENILQKKSLLFSLSVHLGSTWFDLFVCLCGFYDNRLYCWFWNGTVLVESVCELFKSTDDDICVWFCCRWWVICWFYHLRIVGCDTVALFVNNDTADMSSSRVGAVLLMCWRFLSANQPSIYVSLFMLKLKLKISWSSNIDWIDRYQCIQIEHVAALCEGSGGFRISQICGTPKTPREVPTYIWPLFSKSERRWSQIRMREGVDPWRDGGWLRADTWKSKNFSLLHIPIVKIVKFLLLLVCVSSNCTSTWRVRRKCSTSWSIQSIAGF